MRTFWENERPSSSDDEKETENSLYTEMEAKANIRSSEHIIGNIEIVKDLNLSKTELKSEIRKLEYKMKNYRTNLRNQEKIISRLKTEFEVMKNKSQLETIQLRIVERTLDFLTSKMVLRNP